MKNQEYNAKLISALKKYIAVLEEGCRLDKNLSAPHALKAAKDLLAVKESEN